MALKPFAFKPGGMQWTVETGHRTFDRQFTCPTAGSRLGGGQSSCCIRPASETVGPVGQIKPPGYFRDFDIGWMFKDAPEKVKAYIRSATYTEPAIAYQFYHYVPVWRTTWSGQRYRAEEFRRVVHGYVITRALDHLLLNVFYVGPTRKSRQVIDTILPYISRDPKEVCHA